VLFVDHAIGGGRLLVGIAEDGIIGLDVLGELLVRLGIIDTGREVDDVGKGADVVAALTERLALGGSTAGECLGEPGKNEGLALVIRQAVHLAVGALQREGRRHVAGFELGLQRRRGLRRRGLLESRPESGHPARQRPSGE
jgi:hypothetical protein